jgi:hypothetical protein
MALTSQAVISALADGTVGKFSKRTAAGIAKAAQVTVPEIVDGLVYAVLAGDIDLVSGRSGKTYYMLPPTEENE